MFGVPEKAAEAVKNIDEAVTRTKDKAQASGKKALVLLTNDGKVSAYGSGSRFGLVHDALGVAQADKNIKVGVHGQQVTYEYVAMLNPDIIFVVDRSVAIGRSAKNPNVLNNVLVNKTKAAKNGAIILLDPQVWYLSGGGIISLNKMISEVEAAFTDKNNYSVLIHHKTGRTTYASVSRLEQQRRAALFHSGPADEENFAVDGISPSCVCADGLRRAAHFSRHS